MNYIELDVAVSGGKCPLTLCLSEFIDGYTSFQKALSSRPVEYTLVAEPVMKQYRIKLDDFQTNPWWFQQQPVTQQGIPDGSLKKIMNLVIKNSDYETKGVPISIEVKNIRFGRNLFPLNLTIIGLLVVFYAGLIFLKRNSKSRAVSTIVLPDDQLEISTYPDDDTNRM